MEGEKQCEAVTETPFIERCQEVRAKVEELKAAVWAMRSHLDFSNEQTHVYQHAEMKANVMLSYRHLEDARMRMGKAIQARDGGTSCYPK